jgi:tetratricopeptide (TPR) repeat protein
MNTTALLSISVLAVLAPPVAAQGGGTPSPTQQAQREARQLDSEGRHAEARAIWRRLIDEAPDPAARAGAQRRMAMSYGFEGDCASVIKYEQMVIAYWTTREQAEPQNAFYQQGEMANEAARVCLDAGHLDEAERWYRAGSALGNQEPEPRTHPKSLWAYRLAHALARIAAQRGDKAEAERQVAEARRVLDRDPAMAEDQERFYPYLVGYVQLFTGDPIRAESTLRGALEVRGNQNDPFLNYLLALALERLGRAEEARMQYRRAYDLATGHNPPAVFTRPNARKKLSAAGDRETGRPVDG